MSSRAAPRSLVQDRGPGLISQPVGDLDTRSAIHDLVVAFYREVVFDDLLAPVFAETAETDWAAHIPRLVDYWCTILLGEQAYHGALLGAHREVHQRDPLRDEHFDRWYELWVTSIDARWSGPRSEQAKAHAAATAGLISRRLRGVDHDVRTVVN
ncbi:MAG: group III truncated hemoglobin [Acidimicrobiales bacterium]|nr:group III truncated hemoglobin [Acidimicrobiales bacterium]